MFSAKAQAAGFDLVNVSSRALALAQKPYQAPPEVPDMLKSLSFDQWRDIRFRPEDALWRGQGSPFTVEFYHLGFLYNYPVAINTIESGQVRPIHFKPGLFDYGKTGLEGKVSPDAGFAGFRLHFPLNRKNYKDEVIAFLGATYFRAVAKGGGYGQSGRGIAVNTALPSGEEFPLFREFWIRKPPRGASEITVYALLDGPSLTGAYQFVIRPGRQTVVRVDARLFLREPVERLGIAPLTGMFLYGENTPVDKRPDDFRPEVHDCDGLSISLDRREWLWRPVVNPDRLLVNVFRVNALHGFGLLQRDENYDHYLDLEQHPERRPSVWITPRGEWGTGNVYLIQIPTTRESDDNIVTFWNPDRQPAPKEPYDISYTMLWSPAKDLLPPLGYVTSTQSVPAENGKLRFILEFNGPGLSERGSDTTLTPEISAPDGFQIEDVVLQKNEMTSGWRLTFKVKSPEKPKVAQILPQKKEAVELRATLTQNGRPLTETWSYSFDEP